MPLTAPTSSLLSMILKIISITLAPRSWKGQLSRINQSTASARPAPTLYTAYREGIRHLQCLLLAIFLFATEGAFAASTWSPAYGEINLPSFLSVPRDTPIGATIWTSHAIRSELTSPDSNPKTQIWADVQNGPLVSGFSDIYQTSTPGIGVRLMGEWRARNYPGGKIMPITNPTRHNPGDTGWVPGDRYPQRIWIDLAGR